MTGAGMCAAPSDVWKRSKTYTRWRPKPAWMTWTAGRFSYERGIAENPFGGKPGLNVLSCRGYKTFRDM
jgi:hypothetical protein